MGKYTNESWIAAAEQKYPGRFIYDKTSYIDSYHKVKVTCKEHGEVFEVPPISFLRSSSSGNFCPQCRANRKLTHDEFVELAKKRFPLLDFSKTKYTNYRSEVVVTCPDHGCFSKQARRVLHGQDHICPDCIKEHREFDLVKRYTKNPVKGDEPGTFYKLKVTHIPTGLSFIKIGVTSFTSYQRYDDKRYADFNFEVLDEVHTTNLESALLEREYKRKNKHRRFYLPGYIWFSGRSELYELDGYHQLLASQVKFIRDALLEKQGGKCPLCNRDVAMPTLDHYHSNRHYGSGLVRGVLCNTCNRMVGVIENNLARNNIDYSDAPDFLRELVDYLVNKRERYIHPTEKAKPPMLMKSSYNKLVKAVAGKQKVPEYTGRFTKQIEKLYKKYGLSPAFQSRKPRQKRSRKR